jgi:hypothetical protein
MFQKNSNVMFRSKVKEKRIFTKRRRVRRSWLSAIAILALLVLALELLTRIFLDLSGNKGKFAPVGGSDITQAYKLNFVQQDADRANAPQDSLLAKTSLSVGYSLFGNQKNKYWEINQQGFRDRDPVPLVKPQDEVRIFLLGGSTAFGYGNSSNATTVSNYLETRLQQRLQQQQASPQLYKPDLLPYDQAQKQKYLAKPAKIKPGKYRVINAAVPGYASGNELAQVALNILKYKPDLIVILDGYEDLMLPGTEESTPAPIDSSSQNQPNSVGTYLDRLIKPLLDNSYLVKVAQKWTKTQENSSKADFLLEEQASNLVKHLPVNNQELQVRVDRYLDHQKQMLNLSTAAQVPLIVAIQPEITGRNPSQLTDTEGEITQELGRTYIQGVKSKYPAFIEAAQKLGKAYPSNIKVIDLYKLTDKYPSPSFVDPIHLSDMANEKVAEQLYYTISDLAKMQVVSKQAPKPTTQYPQYKNYRQSGENR